MSPPPHLDVAKIAPGPGLARFAVPCIYEVLRISWLAMPKSAPLPTDSELEILRVLWARGPSTVREVHTALGPDRDTGYTGVLKLLQIMLDKRLVDRDDRARSHVYRAAV